MSKTKLRLRFPTVGKKRGDVIEVDSATAEALVANGSAVPVKAAAEPQSKKD